MTQTLTVALPSLQVKVRPGARQKHTERGDCALFTDWARCPANLRAPFYLVNYRGTWPALNLSCWQESCTSWLVAFLYWLAHEEWQTWTLPLETLQTQVCVPFFCISCSVSALNMSVITDLMWRVMWNLKPMFFLFAFFKTKWFCLSKWS